MRRNKDYHVVMQDNDEIVIVSAVGEEELFSAIERRVPDNFWIFYGVRFDTIQAVFEDAPMPSSELSRSYTKLLMAYSDKREGEESAAHQQADEILLEAMEGPKTKGNREAEELDDETIDELIDEMEEENEIGGEEEEEVEEGEEKEVEEEEGGESSSESFNSEFEEGDTDDESEE